MKRQLDRREFTLGSALALLSGVVITVTGCGDEGPSSPSPTTTTTPPTPPTPPTTPPGPSSGDVVGVVGSNHGHQAVIEAAQLAAGDRVVLDIRGMADHPHSVELSDVEVQQIAGGARVSKLSSTEQAHAHTVTFN